MSVLSQEGQSCSSLSAPTPRGGRCGRMGKAKAVPSRRFRSTLNFSSPLNCTRDASAHESAAVRRHFAPGATGKTCPIAGCASALAASVGLAHRLHPSLVNKSLPNERLFTKENAKNGEEKNS